MITIALFLALEPPVLTVDSKEFDIGSKDSVGLDWDCQRNDGKDRLILAEPKGVEGKVPLFTRTLLNQQPKVVVDCSAEVIAFGQSTLSMSSGFCPYEWGLEIKLVGNHQDRAIADLRLGKEWMKGYSCVRRPSGERG